VGASLLPLSGGGSSVSLVGDPEGLGGLGGAEREVEMMFSPQAVSGRFLVSQARVAEVSGAGLPLHSSGLRVPEAAELPGEIV